MELLQVYNNCYQKLPEIHVKVRQGIVVFLLYCSKLAKPGRSVLVSTISGNYFLSATETLALPQSEHWFRILRAVKEARKNEL